MNGGANKKKGPPSVLFNRESRDTHHVTSIVHEVKFKINNNGE